MCCGELGLASYAEHVRSHARLLGIQDDCLIAISDGKKPPASRLEMLPPWRAVLIVRVAFQAELFTQEEVDVWVEKARHREVTNGATNAF